MKEILSDKMVKDNSCFNCGHFTQLEYFCDGLVVLGEGKCDIYDSPNYGISVCNDWTELKELEEFDNKRL